MFVYHSAPIGKVVRCSCIIALLHGRFYMFVYHIGPTCKVVICLCIIALLQGRLLDIRVS